MNRVRVVLVGVGKVGRAFMALMAQERARIRREYGADLELVALARNGRWKPVSEGSAREGADWVEGLVEGAGWTRTRKPLVDAAAHAAGLPGPQRVVVVEAGSGDTSAELATALETGAGAVLANKQPLTGSTASYRRIMGAARRGGGIRFECTVGSALPVVEPIRAMVAGGDRIRKITAALSGTLGFVMTSLGEGRSLASVVAQAKERGLTEPDPRDDLGGVDVARKALILSRLAGWERELDGIAVESLVPPGLGGGTVEAFVAGLRAEGTDLAKRAVRARESGRALRYVATVDPAGARVGLAEYDAASPFGSLAGTDNLFLVESDWYASGPLVVRGPGAGVVLTAAGVLGDLVGLAGEGVRA